MGKLLVASFLSLLAASSSFAESPARVDSLFICTGRSARTYHTDRSCTGLVKCHGKFVSLPAYIIVKKKRLCRKCEAAADSYVVPALQKSDNAKKKAVRKSSPKSKKERRRSYPVRDPLSIPDPLSEPLY